MCADAERTRRVCAKCSRDLGQIQVVHLWDGKDYCRACVTNASPKLAIVAERSLILSESIAINPRDAVRDECLSWCFMGLVFVGFLSLCAWRGGGAVSDGLVVGVLVTFLGFPLRALGAYYKARRVSGRVSVEHACLRIQHPVYGKATWPLHECRWYLGRVWEAETFFRRLYLRRKVVILECPVKVRFLRRVRERVPCGLTEEMREVWEAFLTLAAVERKSRYRWWPQWERSRCDRNTLPVANPPQS